MSTSFLGLNVSQFAVARGTTICLALLSTMTGLHAVIDPAGYAEAFGLPAPSPSMKNASRNLFIPASGGSKIAGGLAMLACFYFKQEKGVALMLGTGAIVAIIDGLSLRAEIQRTRDQSSVINEDSLKSLKSAEGKAWGHILFGPISVALGTWLFYVS